MKKTSKISMIVLVSVFLTTATMAAQYQQVRAETTTPRISVQSQAIPDCDGWSTALDIKLAAQAARTDIIDILVDKLNAVYDYATTHEDAVIFNTLVDTFKPLIDSNHVNATILGAEVDRYNAECAS